MEPKVFHNCDGHLSARNPQNIEPIRDNALLADFRSPAVRRNIELAPLTSSKY